LPAAPIPPASLTGWLNYIEALHPKAIAMGLERVNEVKRRMAMEPPFPVITIGGTNGKGSTCAMLERIYHSAGYRTGCYTSPHFLRYNERVRIGCREVEDRRLLDAFAAVERARHADGESVPLTYFEFGTLAAMWLFMQADIDVLVFEVGLGGRLDAVNAFDPACAVVTSVDLDHMDFLGNDRESIGFEKAGIYRTSIPAICGDTDPPASLLAYADRIKARLLRNGKDFRFVAEDLGWAYLGIESEMHGLPSPALTGDFQRQNAACVLAAVEAMEPRLPVSREHIEAGLRSVKLAGRFQQRAARPDVILDVAHNPQAAQALADNLRQTPSDGRTLAVFAMLADKDIAGVIDAVRAEIDCWYIAGISNVRGADARYIAALMREHDVYTNTVACFADVASAYRQACLDASENDRIIIFGSFYTVADVMHLLPAIHLDD
jgi:dihydrofolate synthase/folylpolyglutamate synthase